MARIAPMSSVPRARALGFTILLFALGSPQLPGCSQGASRRPNIVLIVSDDQDYEQLGFLGAPAARTPTLDTLAAEGTVFTTAHVAASRCRPSLASLLSGRWPQQHGIFYNEGPAQLEPEGSLPRRLADAGYATFLGGKFWEGDPRAMGFAAGEDDDDFVRRDQVELFRFVDEHAGKEPLFVWWAPQIPHWPHDPPPEVLARIDPAAIPIPPYYTGDPEVYREEERPFLAMGAWLDDGVRALREKLASAGVLEDTLFVFLIDNGSATGTISKGSVFEKGVRTPIVVSWPRALPRGRRSDALVASVDVYATLLDYAGLEPPRERPGRSLRPLLEGAGTGRDVLCGAMYPRAAAVDDPSPAANVLALYARTSEWKYVLYFRRLNERTDEMFRVKSVLAPNLERAPGDEDLYRLADDPYEQEDLAERPEHAATLRDLRARALAWWEESGGGPLALPKRVREGQ
jgi:arylsulfatase A-like enzyme